MSFLFGGSSNLPSAAPKPLGIDEKRASTNEQARPIPYMAGKNRVGITWISSAFNIKTVRVTQQSGKDSVTTVGYRYYASIVGLVCHGIVTGLHTVYFNGELVWSGTLSRGVDENYAEITITSHGLMRIYWGTPTQEVCELLSTSEQDHPPYSNQCYIVFDQLYFGFNQTSAPNVELVVSRYPVADWHTAAVNVQDDCNVIAVIAEWLTNPVFGLGWDVSRLNTTALNSIAGILEDEEVGVSPYVDRQTSARQLITQLLEYVDGYIYFTTSGLFAVGLIRKPASVGALPELTAADLVADPDLDPQSWRGIKSKTYVKFHDRASDFKEDAVVYRDAGAAGILGDNTPQTLDRPWVTRKPVAELLAAAGGRAAALPAGTGTLQVRKSSAIEPGGLFRFTFPDEGMTDVVLRTLSKSVSKPGARSVELRVALDRSYLNDEFFLPSAEEEDDGLPKQPLPFEFQRAIELPAGLAEGDAITVGILAARVNRYTTGYQVYFRRNYSIGSSQPNVTTNLGSGTLLVDYAATPGIDETVGLQVSFSSGLAADLANYAVQARLAMKVDSEWLTVSGWTPLTSTSARAFVVRGRRAGRIVPHTSGAPVEYWLSAPQYTNNYDRIGRSGAFASHGLLQEEYPATADLTSRTVGLLVHLDGVDTELDEASLDGALDNEHLVFVGDEILSIVSWELVSADTYRLFCLRGRYGTALETHAEDAGVFIISRENLPRFTNERFFYSAHLFFKLVPTGIYVKPTTPPGPGEGRKQDTLGVSDVDPIDVTITGRRMLPPAPLNLRAFRDPCDPVYATGEDLVIGWDIASERRGSFWSLWGSPLTFDLPATILEFRTSGGVLKRTITTDAGASSYTYTNADLVADFGGEVDVVVRAYHTYGTNRTSASFNTITIQAI